MYIHLCQKVYMKHRSTYMRLGISRLKNNANKLNESKNYFEISNLIVHLGISRLKNNALKLNEKKNYV